MTDILCKYLQKVIPRYINEAVIVEKYVLIKRIPKYLLWKYRITKGTSFTINLILDEFWHTTLYSTQDLW